jgi:hypothetical protein
MKTIFTTVLCTAVIIGQISMASAQYEYPAGRYYYYGSARGGLLCAATGRSWLGLNTYSARRL